MDSFEGNFRGRKEKKTNECKTMYAVIECWNDNKIFVFIYKFSGFFLGLGITGIGPRPDTC